MAINNAYGRGKQLLCGGYSEYTPTGKSYFVKAGRWYTTPKVGDIVYFYYTSLGRVGHVGGTIVVNVDYKKKRFTYVSIEGNTSDSSGNTVVRNGGCVASHEYTVSFGSVGGKNPVNGFGRPMYSDDTCTVEEFIEVLKGELGYLEKASNKNLDDKTANAGYNNYTKYGKWYGDNGAYWCQQFISWCAYTACAKHMEKSKTMWEEQSDGSWKYLLNGEYIKNKWQYIGERWYVFDGSGKMITGWFGTNDGEWYYLNPDDGAMLESQWFEVDNKYYYVTKGGEMAKNTYVKSTTPGVYCWVNGDGVWEEIYDTSNPDLNKYGYAE